MPSPGVSSRLKSLYWTTRKEAYRAFYSGVIEEIRAYVSGEPIRLLNPPKVLTSPRLRGAN